MQTTSQPAELQSRILKTENISWKELHFIQKPEFKAWFNSGEDKLIQSLIKYQFIDPFKVWQHGNKIYCLDGFHRYQDLAALERMGVEVPHVLPATFIHCTNMVEAAELVLVYSSAYARITQKGMASFLEEFNLNFETLDSIINIPEFDSLEFKASFAPVDLIEKIIPVSLRDRFLIPPFSIFDSRQGYWQDRKRVWQTMFNSQETREDVDLIAKSGQSPAIYELRNKMRESLGRDPEWDEILEYAKKRGLHIYKGASVFDPVICEVAYRWFVMDGGSILDPFAGGSVRGIVAGILGYNYLGIDLRADQVDANRQQWAQLANEKADVKWIAGDSNKELEEGDRKFDFVFSCPPYHDLEEYSDDPDDLSNMSYEDFIIAYRSIISKSVQKLKDNRFACFVVGEIRDEKGIYRNFVGDTIQAFIDAGMNYYNEIILVNVAGSLPVRVGRQFEGSRKVGKMHQNILVFYKGDWQKIKEEFPEIKIDEFLQSSE